MLGTSLPNGSEAIPFHNTLFRTSELCWLKAVKLSVPELVVKVVSFLLGLAWVWAMHGSKGGFLNIEFLLAFFPIGLGWTTTRSLKLGCTGDFETSYEGRNGSSFTLFQSWIDTVSKKESSWLSYKSKDYEVLINPEKVAWVRPCFQWKIFPLFVAAVFIAYLKLVAMNLGLDTYPVIEDFRILIFETGLGTVKFLSYLIILTSLVAFGLSIKRSVEVCGTGGVQDVFPTNASEQSRILNRIVGNRSHERSEPEPVERRVVEPSLPDEGFDEENAAIEETIEVAPDEMIP